MIALLQRVISASVCVGSREVAVIGKGVLAFIAVEKSDSEKEADYLLNKLVHYRIFENPDGRMALDLLQVQGNLLLVPQFTLAAKTSSGLRPDFTQAATATQAESIYRYCVAAAKSCLPGKVASGLFSTHMQVTLCNDGPVTFWLQSKNHT